MDELLTILFGWMSSSNQPSGGGSSSYRPSPAEASSGSGSEAQLTDTQSASSANISTGLITNNNTPEAVAGVENGAEVTPSMSTSDVGDLLSSPNSFWEIIGGTQVSISSGSVHRVPEIDAGSSLLAIAAIAAALMLVYERKKRAPADAK